MSEYTLELRETLISVCAELSPMPSARPLCGRLNLRMRGAVRIWGSSSTSAIP